MPRFHSRFWVIVTFLLSLIFAVLFLPLVFERYALGEAILLTAAGIIVIWGVYFIRAYIFSRMRDEQERRAG